MNALPEEPYSFREWRKLKVNMNYHVYAKGCYYSVAVYAHQRLDVVIYNRLVVCAKNKEIARHCG